MLTILLCLFGVPLGLIALGFFWLLLVCGLLMWLRSLLCI